MFDAILHEIRFDVGLYGTLEMFIIILIELI